MSPSFGPGQGWAARHTFPAPKPGTNRQHGPGGRSSELPIGGAKNGHVMSEVHRGPLFWSPGGENSTPNASAALIDCGGDRVEPATMVIVHASALSNQGVRKSSSSSPGLDGDDSLDGVSHRCAAVAPSNTARASQERPPLNSPTA